MLSLSQCWVISRQFPVPNVPSLQAIPKAYNDMYLMNPSKSLLGAMNTFSSRMEQTPGPYLPTFPPFPSKTETQDILKKLMDCFQPTKVSLRRKRRSTRCSVALPGNVYGKDVLYDWPKEPKKLIVSTILCVFFISTNVAYRRST